MACRCDWDFLPKRLRILFNLLYKILIGVIFVWRKEGFFCNKNILVYKDLILRFFVKTEAQQQKEFDLRFDDETGFRNGSFPRWSLPLNPKCHFWSDRLRSHPIPRRADFAFSPSKWFPAITYTILFGEVTFFGEAKFFDEMTHWRTVAFRS